MQCENKSCPSPARAVVLWPGRGLVRYCTKHALWALEVLNCLGLPLVLDSLDEPDWQHDPSPSPSPARPEGGAR